MTADDLVQVMTSRQFLAIGVPFLSVLVEWVIRVNAKPDDEPTFLWRDFDYGMSLLATAFVSIPALLAARTTALEAASNGGQTVELGTFFVGAAGMALIAVVAMLLGRYDRRIGRRYRMGNHGMLTPILGVFVQFIPGLMALSLVYQVTPTAR